MFKQGDKDWELENMVNRVDKYLFSVDLFIHLKIFPYPFSYTQCLLILLQGLSIATWHNTHLRHFNWKDLLKFNSFAENGHFYNLRICGIWFHLQLNELVFGCLKLTLHIYFFFSSASRWWSWTLMKFYKSCDFLTKCNAVPQW